MAQTILEEKKKSRLMTEGSIWKSILLFSVPLILGNMLQQLYNTADSIIVGNFVGSNALAAVGSSGSPIFLLIGFSQGIAVGAGVVVSQFLGAKDREGAHTAVHTSLALSAILGAILTVCGIAVSRALLTAMNTPAEVLEDAVLYMRLYFGGVLFSVVYNMAAGILNAAGNSKRSLLYLGAASITNIVLDLVLIAGCKMGALFQVSPVNAFILCVGMRVLMGVCVGLIFNGLSKLDKSRTWSYIVSAMCAPALNTLFFMGYIVLAFYNCDYVQNLVSVKGAANPLMFVVLLVGVQGVAEFLVSGILGGIVARAVHKFLK